MIQKALKMAKMLMWLVVNLQTNCYGKRTRSTQKTIFVTHTTVTNLIMITVFHLTKTTNTVELGYNVIKGT
jgi:hypothetical protein